MTCPTTLTNNDPIITNGNSIRRIRSASTLATDDDDISKKRMDEERRKLGYGDDDNDNKSNNNNNRNNDDGDSLQQTSFHSVGESTMSNFLKIKDKESLMKSAKERQRSKTNLKDGRRNSVMKSLMVLDIDENDPDYKKENNYHPPSGGGRRYMRRGSVTKHKLDADVEGMQPTEFDGAGGDDSDYGSDYDSGCEEQQDKEQPRRYLRRGSVTKYSLDSKPARDMQPAHVAENHRNFTSSTSRLPPPPSNDFSPDEPYLKKEASPRRSSVPVKSLSLPTVTTKSDHHHHERSSKPHRRSSSNSSLGNRFHNLDDSGRSRTSETPLPGDDLYSDNLDDSGHAINLKSYRLLLKKRRADNTKKSHKSSGGSSKDNKSKDDDTENAEDKKGMNKKSILQAQNSLDLDDIGSNASQTSPNQSSSSLGRRDSNSSMGSLEDSDSEFASEDAPASGSSRWPIIAQRMNKKRPPRLPPSASSTTSPTKDKKASSRNSNAIASPIRKGLQTIDYERDSRSTSTTISSSSWNDDMSVSSNNSTPGRKIKPCLKNPESKTASKVDAHVRFGRITITEFPIILGDNPAVTSGAPVTIDWTPQGEQFYSITAYEQCKPKRRRRRKLLISVSNRAIMLLAAGYSIDEIADASIQVQQIKSGRQESLQNQQWDRVNLLVEHSLGMVANTNSAVTGMVQSTGKKLKSLVVKPLQQTETARMANEHAGPCGYVCSLNEYLNPSTGIVLFLQMYWLR